MKRGQYFSEDSKPESGDRRKPARAPELHATSGAEIEITTSELVLIEPGLYEAVGGDAIVMPGFKKKHEKKLAVQFTVMLSDAGRVTLWCYFNITTGPGRRPHAGPRSKYWRTWCLVAGRKPARGDRLRPSIFRGVLMRVRVHTVTCDADPKPLHDSAYYSVVSDVLEVVAGGHPS